ncbi:uncharacterized protein LOC143150331 [Ptiloglossa arizonensis]|uniref:uncharacterized protein LOC143150331 n=1 Tax=Ptiloglossa arizonensis TaxID=3350558 RepID=UPI003F9F8CA2
MAGTRGVRLQGSNLIIGGGSRYSSGYIAVGIASIDSITGPRGGSWLTAGCSVIIDANSFGRSANYIWLDRCPLFVRCSCRAGEIFVDFAKEQTNRVGPPLCPFTPAGPLARAFHASFEPRLAFTASRTLSLDFPADFTRGESNNNGDIDYFPARTILPGKKSNPSLLGLLGDQGYFGNLVCVFGTIMEHLFSLWNFQGTQRKKYCSKILRDARENFTGFSIQNSRFSDSFGELRGIARNIIVARNIVAFVAENKTLAQIHRTVRQ